MEIYIINIILIFYWWFLYTLICKLKTKGQPLQDLQVEGIKSLIAKHNLLQNILSILPFFQIYLILSLKSTTVGTDTISYIYGFSATSNVNIQDIFNFNIHNLVFNFERGFILFTKSISIFTENYAIYSSIVYIVMILPLYKFIKKHSVMPFLSLILFITFGFLNFYFSALRQSIAISIILISYDFIVERKTWKFVCVIIIASLFHKSALFFLPAYFMMNLTFTPIVGLAYFTSLFIVYILRFSIFGFVTQYIYSGTTLESTGAYTLLLVVFFTFIIGLFFYKKVIKMNSNNQLIYNLIATAVGLMIFNTVSNIGLRIANYYYIFMILFIPNILSSIKDKNIRSIALLIVVIFTLTYYFNVGVNALNCVPYIFFDIKS